MSNRKIIKDFETYRSARREFVNMVADAASKSENVPILMSLDVLSLLRPLLLDTYSGIQQTAALALCRIAANSEKNASEIVKSGILPEIVKGLSSENEHYQKSLCQILHSLSKHTPELAEDVVDCNALPPLVKCLSSVSSQVCEAASLSIASIAIHNVDLAKRIVKSGAIPSIIKCVQKADPDLKKVSTAAIGRICEHSPELAQTCIENDAISVISPLLSSSDNKIRSQACKTLSSIAKHSVDNAELVVEANIFPAALVCMTDADRKVRSSAARLVLEVAKHTQELAQSVVGYGGCAALASYLKNSTDPLPAVQAIGFISSFSPGLAISVIESDAALATLGTFVSSKLIEIKVSSAWALSQIGRHNEETSQALYSLNALSLLLQAYNDPDGDESLRETTKTAIISIVKHCNDISALQPLIASASDSILETTLVQISSILSKNPKVRAPFVESGGFKNVQMIQAEPGSKIKELIDSINDCYPDQAVRFYSPKYAEEIKKEIENS